jgi:hypothetical protein
LSSDALISGRICKFSIVKEGYPKQEFEFYDLFPSHKTKEELIRQMEQELCTKESGYKVSAVDFPASKISTPAE